MTPETAWAEAMKFENRPNPYPFFDELRKTPVARWATASTSSRGYRELLALAARPAGQLRSFATAAVGQPAARATRSPARRRSQAYGKDPSIIATDPPDHDRARRQAMRHFGPPHSPDLIPSMEPDMPSSVNDLLDKAKGKTRIDVVDDFAYPLPVTVICKILGVPLEDEPKFHAWIFDFMMGTDLGPEAATDESEAARRRAARAGSAHEISGRTWSSRFAETPGDGMLSKLVHDDGPDGRMSPREIVTNAMLAAGRGSRLHGQHDLPLRADPAAEPRVLGSVAPPAGADSRHHRGGAAAAVVGAVLSQPVRPRRHRDRGHDHPEGFADLPDVRRGQPRPRRFPNPNAFDPQRRTTSTPVGAAAFTPVSAVRWRDWR